MADTTFIDGLRVFKPKNAPSFVIANCKIKVSDLIKFMAIHSKDDELAFVVKESKKGEFYAALDTYEKKISLTEEEMRVLDEARKKDMPKPTTENPNSDIPF